MFHPLLCQTYKVGLGDAITGSGMNLHREITFPQWNFFPKRDFERRKRLYSQLLCQLLVYDRRNICSSSKWHFAVVLVKGGGTKMSASQMARWHLKLMSEMHLMSCQSSAECQWRIQEADVWWWARRWWERTGRVTVGRQGRHGQEGGWATRELQASANCLQCTEWLLYPWPAGFCQLPAVYRVAPTPMTCRLLPTACGVQSGSYTHDLQASANCLWCTEWLLYPWPAGFCQLPAVYRVAPIPMTCRLLPTACSVQSGSYTHDLQASANCLQCTEWLLYPWPAGFCQLPAA